MKLQSHPLNWNINEPLKCYRSDDSTKKMVTLWPWVWTPVPEIGCVYFKTLINYRYNNPYRKVLYANSKKKSDKHYLKMINYIDWASENGKKCVVGLPNEFIAAMYVPFDYSFYTIVKNLHKMKLVYSFKSEHTGFFVLILNKGPLYKELQKRKILT